MKKVLLGLDSWYPLVDGVTGVVVNYDKVINQTDESSIVFPSSGEEKDEEGKRQYYANVHPYRAMFFPWGNFRLGMPSFDKALNKRLREGGYDILHVHSPFFLLNYCNRVGKKYHIPVVFTFHTKFKEEFMRFTHSRLLTWIAMKYILHNIRRADYVWAVSEGSAQTLKSYGYRGNVRVMGNGTDMTVPTAEEAEQLKERLNGIYPLSNSQKVLLYVGRIVSVKNLTFSFRVCKILKQRGMDFVFFLVGWGQQTEEYKELVTEMGLQQNVVFVGNVEDRSLLKAFYVRADLFLFPSVFDNASLSLMEAAACGTPSLVPQGSSSASLFTDGVNGFTPPLNEDIWADIVQKVWQDPVFHSSLSAAAQREVYRSWQSAVQEAMAAYDEILAARKK